MHSRNRLKTKGYFLGVGGVPRASGTGRGHKLTAANVSGSRIAISPPPNISQVRPDPRDRVLGDKSPSPGWNKGVTRHKC
jgi:hypothetical protein